MSARKARLVALTAVGGIMLQFGACLGSGAWRYVLTDAALSAAYEYVWDNDAVLDLFQDDHGTATQYDDRFSPDPSRGEPAGFDVGNLGAGN